MDQLLQQLPPLLREMTAKGIPYQVTPCGVVVEGFYKSSSVRLVPVTIFRNKYRHEDCRKQPGVEWEDTHDCTCNDRCPSCNAEIQPYHSDELESKWKAIDRYDGETTIESFRDLLDLNFSWWDRSWDRISGGWGADPNWLPHLQEAGYVETQTKHVPKRTR